MGFIQSTKAPERFPQICHDSISRIRFMYIAPSILKYTIIFLLHEQHDYVQVGRILPFIHSLKVPRYFFQSRVLRILTTCEVTEWLNSAILTIGHSAQQTYVVASVRRTHGARGRWGMRGGLGIWRVGGGVGGGVGGCWGHTAVSLQAMRHTAAILHHDHD